MADIVNNVSWRHRRPAGTLELGRKLHPLDNPPRERPPEGVTITTPPPNPNPPANSRPAAAGPPTKHQLALMIWLGVFPTLTVLNLALGGWLRTLTPVVRTFVLVTIAVPIVSYALMPQLHRLRRRLLTSIASN